MFDIGFPEIVIISLVALLVIGPERLPEALRTLALWIGRFRRSFNQVKSEIEKEIGADEIRRQLYNESIMAEAERLKAEARDLQSEFNNLTRNAEAEDEPTTTKGGSETAGTRDGAAPEAQENRSPDTSSAGPERSAAEAAKASPGSTPEP